jgi:hypothetical protein
MTDTFDEHRAHRDFAVGERYAWLRAVELGVNKFLAEEGGFKIAGEGFGGHHDVLSNRVLWHLQREDWDGRPYLSGDIRSHLQFSQGSAFK